MRSDVRKDRSEIIACVTAFYRLISGNRQDKRDWQEFSRLFATDARLSVMPNADENEITTFGVKEYVSRLSTYLKSNDFWERGSDLQVAVFHHIASVTGRYVASTERDFQTIIKGGTNYVQLVRIRNRWRIFSMLWEDSP